VGEGRVPGDVTGRPDRRVAGALALGVTPGPSAGVVTAPRESILRGALALVDVSDLQRLTAE